MVGPFHLKKSVVLSLLVVVTLFLLSASVFAEKNTQLNVTMEEIVYQNTTFAEDFYLEEDREFCMVEGSVNVSNVNPDGSTIFDIYLSFPDIEELTSDFYHVEGRDGMIWGGPELTENITNETIGDTTNNYTLPIDIDTDGEDDYVWVSDDGEELVFNLSSEDENFNHTIDTGEDIAIDDRNYGTVTTTGSTDADEVFDLGDEDNSLVITRYEDAPVVLYVPELRENESSYFVYNMSCEEQPPPVNISTEYSNEFHPDVENKVLTGHDWVIDQTVLNDNIAGEEITKLNITMATQAVEWNESEFYFNFSHLYDETEYDNENVTQVDGHNWWWAPAGGTLGHGENESIRYNMTAPFSVPESATYLALVENVTYDVDYMFTNLSVSDINASADIEFEEEKRIFRPADDERGGNVTWETTPHVYTEENITYDLNKVEMWVTENQDPQNYTGLSRTYDNDTEPLAEINLTESWGNRSEHAWRFNYTDASDPPIVWVEPEWLIANRDGQIKNFTTTRSGKDLYMKYMYVIGGYWLMIDKNITNIGEGEYMINTTVKNIGDAWTPQNETVMVYDFVPEDFEAYGFSNEDYSDEEVGEDGSEFHGTSYRWNIPIDNPMNASLGPKSGPDNVSEENYTWEVGYKVNGTGPYQVTDLYIVGLDPLKVDGASASPIIEVISGIQSRSNEIFYAGIVVFLVLLNVTNLIMTHRINHKISKNMPAPPPKPKRARANGGYE